MTADQAYLRVQRAEPPAFVGFIDASLGEPSYLLHLQHTIKAVEKALKLNWLDFDNFDREEYVIISLFFLIKILLILRNFTNELKMAT